MDTQANHNILYIINKLKEFWGKYGIEEIPSFCMPVGAATYHPFCLISALSHITYNNMYVNACIRHDDASCESALNNNIKNSAFHRYAQHYQLNVLWKNAPLNILDLYKESLKYIGINEAQHIVKFVNSKWETKSMGAFGYGFEIYVNDLEVTQFTYFQQICDIDIKGTFVEIAYGIERLAIALYNKKIHELYWSNNIPYNILRLQEETHRGIASGLLKVEDNINTLLNNVNILCNNGLFAEGLKEWLKANDNFNALNANNRFDQASKVSYMSQLRSYAARIGKMYVKGISLQHAINLLNNNDVVILPTETVYGVFTKTNIDKIYQIKQRPVNLKLGVYLNHIPDWLSSHNKWHILQQYIPGPICIIYNNQAYRWSSNQHVKNIIDNIGEIYGSSANVSGHYSFINHNINLNNVFVLEDGVTEYKFESTIIDINNDSILRHGVIDLREHFKSNINIITNIKNYLEIVLTFDNFYEYLHHHKNYNIFVKSDNQYSDMVLNNILNKLRLSNNA